MAIFQFNSQTVAYEIDFAPFSHDLLLLQSSRFNSDFWRPVIDDLLKGIPSGGRIITVESPLPENAEIFERFMGTLGLHNVHVVAYGEAAELVGEVSKLEPGIFTETLLYPQGGPKGLDLIQAVRDFNGV